MQQKLYNGEFDRPFRRLYMEESVQGLERSFFTWNIVSRPVEKALSDARNQDDEGSARKR
jgi:hypothetical protein